MKEKTKNKQNKLKNTTPKYIANPVGVAPLGDPLCEGITLIAIIITVIIMIILLGVTVTGAINGGLFGITKEAAKKTNMQIAKEEVEISFMKYKNERKGNKTLKDHFIEDLGIKEDKTIYYTNANAIVFWYKDYLFVLDGNDGEIKAIGGQEVKSDNLGIVYEDLLDEGKYILYGMSSSYHYNWGVVSSYKTSLKTFFVNNDIEELGDWSPTSGCKLLETVYLPDNLKMFSNNYGSYFGGCTSLKKVILPYGIETLGHAFGDSRNNKYNNS